MLSLPCVCIFICNQQTDSNAPSSCTLTHRDTSMHAYNITFILAASKSEMKINKTSRTHNSHIDTYIYIYIYMYIYIYIYTYTYTNAY